MAGLGRRWRGLLAWGGRNPAGALLGFQQGEVNTRGWCRHSPHHAPAPDTPPAASASGPWPVPCCATKRRTQIGRVAHPGAEWCVEAGALRQAVSCPSAEVRRTDHLSPPSPVLGSCRGPGTAGLARSQVASLWGSAPGSLTGQDSREEDTGDLGQGRNGL